MQLPQNPNLTRFRSVVGGTTCGSATGGHTPPSTPTSSCLGQFGSSIYVDDDSGGHAPPSAPTPSRLRQLGSPFYVDEDLQDMENIPVMGMSPMHGGGFEQVLSDGDGLAASTVSSALALMVEYDAAPNEACQAHAAPAPVVEYAPAPNMAYQAHAASAPEVTPAPDVAYRAHAAPAPVVECDAPAPTVTYRAHAAPAPVVECDAPAPTVTYWKHAASAPEVTPAPDVAYRAHAAAAPVVTPAPVMMDKFIEKLDAPYEPEDDESVCGKWASEKGEVEYIASAAAGYAGLAPNEEKYFISMTRLEEVSCAKTI